MRGKQWQLRLSNRDERGRDAGGPAIMRLGANDGPDEGLNLIHSVRPVICQKTVVVVFPAVCSGTGTPKAPDLSRERALSGRRLNCPLQVEHQVVAHVKGAGQGRACRSLEREEASAEQSLIGRVQIAAVAPSAGE